MTCAATLRSLLITALLAGCVACDVPGSGVPAPERLPYEVQAVRREGCPVAVVQVPVSGPLSAGGDPARALRGQREQDVTTAQLCFAVQALRAWADAAPLEEPYFQPGDGQRIVSYWREPGPPPDDPEEVSSGGSFTLGAEVPGRPRTLWIKVDKSMLREIAKGNF